MCKNLTVSIILVRFTMSSTTQKPERSKPTTPAEERGERIDTAKIIESGGKAPDHSSGATPEKKERCDDDKQESCDRPPS
jgi:hypothetical protein